MTKKIISQCIVCILYASTGLHAATINWSAAVDGDWNTPANWTDGAVPTVSDDANIKKAANVTVANGTTSVAIFSDNGGADASRTAGTYTVTDAAGDVSGTGADFTVVVATDGTPTVALVSGGVGYADNETITIADSSLGLGGGADVVVTVTTAATAVANNLITGNNSTLTVNTGGVLAITGSNKLMHVGNSGSISNGTKNGTVQLNSGGKIVVSNKAYVGSWEAASAPAVPPSSILNIAGGTLEVQKELQIGLGGNGTLELSGGTVSFVNTSFWQNLKIGSGQGDGVVNMTGGNLVTSGINMDGDDNSIARINLDGGILEVSDGWAGDNYLEVTDELDENENPVPVTPHQWNGVNNGRITSSSNSVIAISDGVFQWKGTNKITAINAMVNSGFITFATSTLSGNYPDVTHEKYWTSPDGNTTLYADTDEVRDGYTTVWALSNDSDGDGLADSFERDTGIFVSATDTGTDPNDPDTDDDGLADGVETNTGTFVSASDTGTNPHLPDTDSDGLRDDYETSTGVYVSDTDTGTNPLLSDTDGDTIPDGVETGLDPNTNSADAIALLPSAGYTEQQLIDLRVGSKLASIANEQATLQVVIEQSDDLGSWSTLQTEDVTVAAPAGTDKQFFRYRMQD